MGLGLVSRQKLWDLELEQLGKERIFSDPDPEMWKWSPLELWEFDKMLVIARQAFDGGLKKISFCEAGCGIGTKLYLAEHYHDLSAVGYEISHDYLEQAALLHVDARYMDFREEMPDWSLYDIIYIGRPFKTDEMESEFEQYVQDNMRRGAVLMMAWAATKPYSWPCYYRGPFRGVWRKPKFKLPDPPIYDAMIKRQPGYDPLVSNPVGYPG